MSMLWYAANGAPVGCSPRVPRYSMRLPHTLPKCMGRSCTGDRKRMDRVCFVACSCNSHGYIRTPLSCLATEINRLSGGGDNAHCYFSRTHPIEITGRIPHRIAPPAAGRGTVRQPVVRPQYSEHLFCLSRGRNLKVFALPLVQRGISEPMVFRRGILLEAVMHFSPLIPRPLLPQRGEGEHTTVAQVPLPAQGEGFGVRGKTRSKVHNSLYTPLPPTQPEA